MFLNQDRPRKARFAEQKADWDGEAPAELLRVKAPPSVALPIRLYARTKRCPLGESERLHKVSAD